ncbi:agmatine deiminase family protein [Clostridium aciditolerans]|uniref:Agmatine deiminase family protein n=1 Tax=Clostridium aciditolerans TaxID=339861 RepID=A0A934HS25_9CLOT|nr:agmatine deiminase family protein [Clostridium aciditolerans]MBI6873456.1 agmatine deiminase family protein [Clostridium aciditolerans]
MEKYRTVGEFEKQESVMIIWPRSAYATKTLNNDVVSTQVVQAIIDEVKVIICCFDNDVQKRAKSVLDSEGVDTSLIEFLIFPSRIVYPRDFGAEVMISDKGNRARVDFRFDMYGYYKEDDELSKLLYGFSKFHAESVGIENTRYCDLISEGGDHEFNGKGIMMAIRETEVDKRNSNKSLAQVEKDLKEAFNLDQIIWLPQCSYDDDYSYNGPIPSADGLISSYRAASANGHIDEICRFVSEDTILIAYISDEEARDSKLHSLNKERLDKAYKAVKSAKNFDGQPFKILKMPVPEPIYININPDDDAYGHWHEAKEEMNGLFLDGTSFPEDVINVLPAISYCNFLIVNNVVVAQKYYEEGMLKLIKEKDEEALAILKSAFPNHKIVQVNPLALNLYGGGIHCHTRNVPSAI